MSDHHKAMTWLAGGDTGLSSESIMYAAFGVMPKHGYRPPSDPADLGRCLRLLRQFPEWPAERWQKPLAKSSFVWRAMINHWEDLKSSMENEVGLDWEKGDKAPKTYDLMKRIEGRAYADNRDLDVILSDRGHLRSARRRAQP